MWPLTPTTRFNYSSNFFLLFPFEISPRVILTGLQAAFLRVTRSLSPFSPRPYPAGQGNVHCGRDYRMTNEQTDRMQEMMQQTEERWRRVRRALKREDQVYADRLAAMIHAHAEDRFPSISDPLEAVMLTLFIELQKQIRPVDSPPRDRE
jgi:hypothetical protein